ncbi:MAG: hypothetical protein CMJ59_15800 [Planctomycetaceae bacterium]|nr:hypothetical protein [Planctomycetaceae bacterium]
MDRLRGMLLMAALGCGTGPRTADAVEPPGAEETGLLNTTPSDPGERPIQPDDAPTPLPAAAPSPLQDIAFHKIRGATQSGAVFDLGASGSFDAFWATCPSVQFDGKLYRMWYSSVYDNRMGAGGIGLVTSPDGLHWTRANGGKPVLQVGPPGAFDDGQVLAPEVLYDGTRYRMWYTGSSTKWHTSGVCHYRIGLALSKDGIHWQRANHGRPVLDLGAAGSYDGVQAATPTVLVDADGYRMWYAAWAPRPDHTICVARSRDGIHWQREDDGKPVTGLLPTRAYGPKVCRVGNQLLLLFAGSVRSKGTYLFGAVSSDGFQWAMIGKGQPIIPPGVARDFDAEATYHPAILRVDDRLRVWYTGVVQQRPQKKRATDRGAARRGTNRLQIGLAEARLRKPAVR